MSIFKGFSSGIDTTNQPTKKSGSYFSGFSDNPTEDTKIYDLQNQAKEAQAESDKANSFGTIFRETVPTFLKQSPEKTSEDILSTANEAVKNTWETYKNFPNEFWNDLKNAGKIIKNAPGDIRNSPNKGNAGGSALEAATKMGNLLMPIADVANAVFAPISAAFGAVMQQTGGQKLIDHAGNTIVDKSGITDMPKFQQYALQHPDFARKFNNLLMLATVGAEGLKGEEVPKKMVDAIHNLAKETIEQAKPVDVKPEIKPTMTPEERQAAYARSQGYEPYTPADQLPTIDMGKPVKDSMPTIQIGESVRVTKNSKGDYVYEPIKEPGFQPAAPAPTPEPISVPAVERPVLPDGTRVSKGASDINASLIEKGMRPLTPDEQARYNPTNEPEQDSRISQLLSDPVKLKSIIEGSEPVPNGIVSTLLKERIAEFADRNGDVQMSIDLAKSKLASASSEAGQALSFSGDKKINTTTDALEEIQKAREKTYEGRTGKKARDVRNADIKNAKIELAKAAPGKGAWEEFINNIKCNY